MSESKRRQPSDQKTSKVTHFLVGRNKYLSAKTQRLLARVQLVLIGLIIVSAILASLQSGPAILVDTVVFLVSLMALKFLFAKLTKQKL